MLLLRASSTAELEAWKTALDAEVSENHLIYAPINSILKVLGPVKKLVSQKSTVSCTFDFMYTINIAVGGSDKNIDF